MIPAAHAPPSPLYARFSRRFRGILVDWMIAMAVIFGGLSVAIAVGNDNFSRALGFGAMLGLLLYEPVLVSATGGTLGHYFNNLRVVDQQSGGNVSFLKACARVVIKGLLGWFSFVVLAATRRNQAIHDLLTRSTVQIRDAAKARRPVYHGAGRAFRSRFAVPAAAGCHHRRLSAVAARRLRGRHHPACH